MRRLQRWLFGYFIISFGFHFLSAQITPPFIADFESSEDYNLGDLDTQNGWVRNQGQVTIISGPAFSGDNFTSLIANSPFSQISILLNEVGGDEIVFVDFYLKPKAGDSLNIEEVVDSEGALISFVNVDSKGEVYVFNGDGVGDGDWLASNTNNSLTTDDISQNWLRLTVRHDFNEKIWDLSIDGTLQTINLGLIDDAVTYLNEFVLMGDRIADVNFDLFSLTTTNPLFIDADNDGIDDTYENVYGLNISLNDRDLDPDGDGLSNIEEFLYNTFADDPDSDEDNVSDGDEIKLNTDPLQYDSAITLSDSDFDGLPDDWELQFFGNLNEEGNEDPDVDGISNSGEFNDNSDPTDYYNGVLPALSISRGDSQTSDPDTYLINPLVVSVSDAGGNPLVNAPVEFSVTSMNAQVAEDVQSTRLSTTLTLQSDTQGEVSAFVLLGSNEGENVQISATVSTGTQSSNVIFDAAVADDSYSSDITSQGAVTNTGNAIIHAVVSGEQGELKSVAVSGKGKVEFDVLHEPANTIAFYSFVFTSSVSENPADHTMLDVAGAVTVYPWYDNLDKVTSGYLKAMSGDSGLDWINSGIFYGLKDYGESKVPLHITLRLDKEQGVWDLFFQDKLWIADIDYIPGDDKIIITSGSEHPTTLRELLITESNPLFEDINKDGLPDSFEIAQGYSPTTNNRHALMPGGTMTLLHYYLNSM